MFGLLGMLLFKQFNPGGIVIDRSVRVCPHKILPARIAVGINTIYAEATPRRRMGTDVPIGLNHLALLELALSSLVQQVRPGRNPILLRLVLERTYCAPTGVRRSRLGRWRNFR